MSRTAKSKSVQRNKSNTGLFVFILCLIFLILFAYSSLNLKNIDYGYVLQNLVNKQQRLDEELDQLVAQRAQLLNLRRVNRIATEQLGYQTPEPDQIIRVNEAP